MKAIRPALLSLLQSKRAFFVADLFTIVPPAPAFTGAFRLTSCDRDVLFPANLLLWSEDFSQSAVWLSTATGTTSPVVTANFTTAPDGTNTADKIAFPDTTGGGKNASVGQDFVDLGATVMTFGCWLRTDTTGTVLMGIDDQVGNSTFKPITLTSAWKFYAVSGFAGSGFPGAGITTFGLPAINVYAWGAQVNTGPAPSPYAKTTSTNQALWSSKDFLATRGQLKWSIGMKVDTLAMTIDAKSTALFNGQPLLKLFQQGYFDGARFQYDRLYGSGFGLWVDSVTLFTGNVADVKSVGRTRCEFEVRSRLELLNQSLPRVLFQPGCRWSLFDQGCALSKASFAVNVTYVASGSNALTLKSNATNADNYFALGTITFTSGKNIGLSATVKSYLNSGGTFTINKPMPYPIANGDTFTAYPGCDKTQSTCLNKFSNLINFGGQPYIPVPETAF